MRLYIKYLWSKYVRGNRFWSWQSYKEIAPWFVKDIDDETKLQILRNPEIKKIYGVSINKL